MEAEPPSETSLIFVHMQSFKEYAIKLSFGLINQIKTVVLW
jgi:hypothetical protein